MYGKLNLMLITWNPNIAIFRYIDNLYICTKPYILMLY